MSSNVEVKQAHDSPSTRRGRSSSSSSASNSFSPSSKGKQVGSKVIRKSSCLPAETVEYLKTWMMSPEHVAHPYPTEQEKALIMEDTGIELKQLTNWFVNNRKRYWKPRVEARLQHEVAAPTPMCSPAASTSHIISTSTSSSTSQIVSTSGSSEICARPAPQQAPTLTLRLKTAHAGEPANAPKDILHPSLKAERAGPLASYVPSMMAPRAVSEASTSGSESGNMSDASSTAEDSIFSEEREQCLGTIARSETVTVHILRPICFLGKGDYKHPTIEDVTILSNVPSSRVIRSYRDIRMTYYYSKDIAGDRKKIQGRRDAEVVRIKKQYLKQYIDDCSAADLLAMRSSPIKRKLTEEVEDIVLRRRKFSEPCPALFREVCTTANHVYDVSLPSLEEATILFGYAQ